jgi:hypothetical protein
VSSDTSITATTRDAGIVARFSNSNNYYHISINAGADAFRIVERNAASETVRATTSVTIATGTQYTISVTLSGATITATLDGANEISYDSATLNQTSTVHGIMLATTTDTIDDYTVATGDIVVPPDEYTPALKFDDARNSMYLVV